MKTRRGMTLAECLVAVVVASVLLAAIDGSLMAGRRYTRLATATRGVRQNLRSAAAVLRGELQPLSPASGDLLSISDSSIVLRAQRAFGIVCAPPAAGALVLDDSTLVSLRTIDPTKDSALILRDGNPVAASDDRWVGAAVTQVRRGTCSSGAGGTAVSVSLSAVELAGVGLGAPVRVFEIDDYRRYKDAAGAWWLGVRNPAAGGWSASSPLAGPLDGKSGLVFRFFDAGGAPVVRPESVVTIEASVRMQDPRRFDAPGRVAGIIRDSLRVVVTPGGP